MKENSYAKLSWINAIAVALVAALAPTSPVLAEPESNQAQEQSATAQAAQPQVDSDVTQKAEEQRKKIIDDAVKALDETKNALTLLAENKTQEALAALEVATGKLELILARKPDLALAPVGTRVFVHDLYADAKTVKDVVKEVRKQLGDGRVQAVRPVLADLASEIVYETTSLPLASYPAAIKEAARLIDNEKTDEAKVVLQTALNTLVVTDVIVPLPLLRAHKLLEMAEKLAENDGRDSTQNEELDKQLAEVRNQIELAEALGYGEKRDFKPIYEQIKEIEKKSSGGKSGTGWFDKIKEQIADLF